MPPRVDQIEQEACYVFTMSSPEIDTLFRTATESVPLETTKPRVVRDPRIKLIQERTRNAFIISARHKLIALDAMHVYKTDPVIVKKAVAAVLTAARRVKPRDHDCFSPEPPQGWCEGLPKGWREDLPESCPQRR